MLVTTQASPIAQLATTAHGGYVTSANGYDLIFTSDAACATKLSFEIDTYNGTTGAGNWWVLLSTLSSSANSTIYMCFGNSAVTTSQENVPAVWNTYYLGVWHFGDGATLSYKNSVDGIVGTPTGSPTAITTLSGTACIGGCINFPGGANYIDSGESTVFNVTGLSVEVFIDSGTAGSCGTVYVFASNANGSGPGYQFYTCGNGFDVQAQDGGSPYFFLQRTASSAAGTPWYFVGIIPTGGGSTLYQFVNNSALTGPYYGAVQGIGSSSNDLFIGSSADGSNTFYGGLDELRIYSGVEPADWRLAVYTNESAPTSFFTLGSVTPI
jgi:hypothetical protein